MTRTDTTTPAREDFPPLARRVLDVLDNLDGWRLNLHLLVRGADMLDKGPGDMGLDPANVRKIAILLALKPGGELEQSPLILADRDPDMLDYHRLAEVIVETAREAVDLTNDLTGLVALVRDRDHADAQFVLDDLEIPEPVDGFVTCWMQATLDASKDGFPPVVPPLLADHDAGRPFDRRDVERTMYYSLRNVTARSGDLLWAAAVLQHYAGLEVTT